MNPTDIYELQLQYIDIISGVWELWLAATFAFVVGFHAGRETIGRFVLFIGCFLYLGTSFLLAARFVDYGLSIGFLDNWVVESGHSSLPRAPWAKGPFYIMTSLLIMTIGSVASTIYAFRVAWPKKVGGIDNAA